MTGRKKCSILVEWPIHHTDGVGVKRNFVGFKEMVVGVFTLVYDEPLGRVRFILAEAGTIDQMEYASNRTFCPLGQQRCRWIYDKRMEAP